MIFINGIIFFKLYLHEFLNHMFCVEMCAEYLETMFYNGFMMWELFLNIHI